MRDEYKGFRERGCEILAVGPNRREEFVRYWANERMPFPGMADPEHRVAQLYKQEVKMLRAGRMPMLGVVDKKGRLRYVHYGTSMSDIPTNEVLLRVIDEVNRTS